MSVRQECPNIYDTVVVAVLNDRLWLPCFSFFGHLPCFRHHNDRAIILRQLSYPNPAPSSSCSYSEWPIPTWFVIEKERGKTRGLLRLIGLVSLHLYIMPMSKLLYGGPYSMFPLYVLTIVRFHWSTGGWHHLFALPFSYLPAYLCVCWTYFEREHIRRHNGPIRQLSISCSCQSRWR